MTVTRRNHGRGHSYYDDGRKLDGVTTLLDQGLAKPALIKWAAETTAGYAVDHWAELEALPVSERLKTLQGARFKALDEAGRRGTEVHRLAERLIAGTQVDVPEQLAGHVESAVRFMDEWNPEPLITETTVVNRSWLYAGTTDGVVRLPDGRVCIYDWKTSRSGIFGEVAMQLAAYAHAEAYVDDDGSEKPMSDLGISEGFGVHVRADDYDVYRLDISDRVFRSFCYVAQVARMREEFDSWRSDALAHPVVAEVS